MSTIFSSATNHYSRRVLLQLLLALAGIPTVIYGQSTPVSRTSASASPNADYQAPVFTDADRVKKIESAFPALEKMYREYAEKHHFPGFVFGVVVDGKLLHSGKLGYTNVAAKTPAGPKSVFRIASMTKSFTAMAILQLRDAGKLTLDDPVAQYIPEMNHLQYLSTDAPLITIRHLLTHAAGFPEDNPWGDRQLADTDQELIQLVEQGVSFSNVPGVAYEYSNLGFALLGNIVTRVSGKPYQQYIQESILKPLGMQDSYWEYSQVPASQLALGYRRVNNQWQTEELLHDGSYGAMGGMLTSLEDFSRYMALHLSAWPPRSGPENPVLTRSSLREMHQLWQFGSVNPQYRYPSGRLCPMVSGYGFGLRWTKDCDNRVSIGHSGGLPGFGSNWIILPEYGIGLVCFSNLMYAPTATINMQVMDTLITLAGLQPRQLPVAPILKKRQNELISLLPDWKNASASGIFAENFFLDNSPEALQKEVKAMYAKAGKIVKVRELIPENQLRGTFLMEGEKTNLRVSFTLSPEPVPLIQAFDIREASK
jgi:CubicO group peptidase (beta-lactamase class C family)